MNGNSLKRAFEDFRVFLCILWNHLGLPPPTTLQLSIAHYLQHGPRWQIIQAFRGCGKSWITAAFVLWCLLVDNQEKILVVSASKDRADGFTSFCLRLIREVPILRHMTPGPFQRESVVCFDVAGATAAQSASMTSKGISSQLAGNRATRIIADDVEVPNNSATEDAREKLLRQLTEFNAILIPEGKTQITILGTPQTEESVYKKLVDQGYSVRIWPAEYVTEESAIDKYKRNIAPYLMNNLKSGISKPGDPTEPTRFNRTELQERKLRYGTSGYALQFLLDTAPSDAEKHPLRCSDFIVFEAGVDSAPIKFQYGSGPEQRADIQCYGLPGDRWYRPLFVHKEPWKAYEGILMSIDPAGRGSDNTGVAVVAQMHGYLFILWACGLPGGYDSETMRQIDELCHKYKPKEIIVESNFGDGMFTELLKPALTYDVTIEEVRHSTQKERRIIDSLEPALNQHRLIMHPDVITYDTKQFNKDYKHSLFWQMTRLTKDRNSIPHDDVLDAVAIAVNRWTVAMARDAEKAVETERTKRLMKEIEEFIKRNSTTKKYTLVDRRF